MLATGDFQLTDDDFQAVRTVVYDHCGISLSDDKRTLVRARLAKQVRTGQFTSATDYLEHALADRKSTAFTEFIDAISTNLTSFFRESDHFDYLSNTVLPAMLKHKREIGDGRIRAWSAACSSGEEPYSLAITILEAINLSGFGAANWDIRLLATDISTRMLARARAGIYTESQMASVPPRHRGRYFKDASSSANDATQYAVSSRLSDIVRFRHLNLMEPWPFKGPFDFIFCRNVMIYFDSATQEKLVERYSHCLSPGGLLFTGHSESLTGIKHRFQNIRPSIYQKP